jgi:hypothetical protein
MGYNPRQSSSATLETATMNASRFHPRLPLITAATFLWACLAPLIAAEDAKPPAQPAKQGSEVRLPGISDLWKEEACPVGLEKQLLVDDFVISHRHNIHRDLNQPTKAKGGKPVLVREKPWEQANLFQVQSVRREDGKFVMNYGYTGPVDYACRAESEDGVHWTRSLLRQREFQGSKENNLLDHQGAVSFLDPHETDPAHKFKAVHRPLESTSLPHAVCLAYSADGLHWTSYNDGKPVTERAADTLNQLAWDERAKLYRLFTRTDFGAGGGPTEYRGSREMINPDVKGDPTNWKTVRNWIFDREGPGEVKRRQIHTVNFWQHEGIDFGLLVVMEWPAFNIPQVEVGDDRRRHERDVWNLYLATRRGGHASDWDLSWVYAGKPLVPRGESGAFDKDLIHPAASIVTWRDQHWLYYTGWPHGHMRHPYLPAIGLATLPLDRFISLEPWKDSQPGWIITKPFKLEGTVLELNADVSSGSLAVEILDEDGNAIAGFSRNESQPLEKVDGLRLRPQWKDQPDLSSFTGRTIRLKIILSRAKLYAFQIKGAG